MMYNNIILLYFMFQDYVNEIVAFANYYHNQISNDMDSLELAEYICEIFKMFIDKKKIKYFYPEMVEQIICEHVPELNDKYIFTFDEHTKKRLQQTVIDLKNSPQAPQRSPEWYAIRKTSIGASEIATIFNKNPFMSRNDLLLKKLDYKDPNKIDRVSIHCIHGIKYEDIAIACYEKYNHTRNNDFGSIKDKNISCIAASPDGISDDGTMVEIKCPYTRTIFGCPGLNYWHQMQQQLHVCELLKCDFLECKILEYNWSEFKKDKLNNSTQEIGIIVEYMNVSDIFDPFNALGWFYAPLDLSINEYVEWIEIQKKVVENDPTKEFSRIIPWKLKTYSLIKIYKNQKWWDIYGLDILKFWDELEILKLNGYDSIIPKKKERKRKPVQMMFVNDP